MTTDRYWVHLRGEENVLRLIAVLALQLGEHTKSYQIIHFKWANCKECKFYPDKTIFKMWTNRVLTLLEFIYK